MKIIFISKKKSRKIIMNILANYLIGNDALKHCDYKPEDITDGINHLTNNTTRIISIIGGNKWLKEANVIINKYKK